MTDPLATWESTLAAVPQSSSQATAGTEIASWFAARVVSAGLTGITDSGSPSFVFAEATFASGIAALAPTVDPSAGATAFASAWETAILASSLTFSSGAYIGAPTPATTFSVITTQIIDPVSITAAKAAMVSGLVSAPLVDDIASSTFASVMRSSFLLLTGTLTGLDSTPPIVGPLPLVAASVAFN